MLFRGYLPMMSGWAMAEFLYRLNVNFGNLKAATIGRARWNPARPDLYFLHP
jgi:hypothetical protein